MNWLLIGIAIILIIIGDDIHNLLERILDKLDDLDDLTDNSGD